MVFIALELSVQLGLLKYRMPDKLPVGLVAGVVRESTVEYQTGGNRPNPRSQLRSRDGENS